MSGSHAMSRMYGMVDALRERKITTPVASLDAHRFLREACQDPRDLQKHLLELILREARDTEIGRRCGFDSITSVAEFRARVPVHTYEDLRPAIDRMCDGERDVLWPGQPVFFAQTSGTTGAPKRVPYSAGIEYEYMPFLLASYGAVEADIPGAVDGRQMILSRFIEGHTAGGIPYGAASGFARTLLESIAQMTRVPGVVFDEPKLEVRYYAMFLYMLSQPLVWLSALNPSTLLTFIDQLDGFGERLARDLAAGTWAHGPDGVDALLRTAVPPPAAAPARAARMQQSLAAHGRINLEDICPELRMITIWKGGNAKHYLGQVRGRLPSVRIRSEVSGSSEGALLIPLDDATDGGVPALFTTFYEMLPADLEPSAGVFHELGELEDGRGYRFVVTNRRGMYRFVMDDVFFVERREGMAPVLRFSHRHGLTSSLTGEKLTEHQIIEAVQGAETAAGVTVLDYQARPVWGEPPGYVILVELEGASAEQEQRFIVTFESKLRDLNIEYASKRDSRRLAPSGLVPLPRGELRRWQMNELVGSGRSDAQMKIPRLRRELWQLPAELRRVV